MRIGKAALLLFLSVGKTLLIRKCACGRTRGFPIAPGPFGIAPLNIVIGTACTENLSTAAAVPLPFQGRFG